MPAPTEDGGAMSERTGSDERVTKHFLVITGEGDEKDFELEHDAACPKEVVTDTDLGGQGTSYFEYTCLVGGLVRDMGIDFLEGTPARAGEVDAWRSLPPGRYELEGWTQHYPATPMNGGEEWDAGLRLVEDLSGLWVGYCRH